MVNYTIIFRKQNASMQIFFCSSAKTAQILKKGKDPRPTGVLMAENDRVVELRLEQRTERRMRARLDLNRGMITKKDGLVRHEKMIK